MPTTLTHVPTGDTQAIPLVLGYAADRTATTLAHTIIGQESAPEFTVKRTGPRTGSYRMLMSTPSLAATLQTFLCRTGAFTLADTGTATVNTTFVVTGRVGLELDDQTWTRCVVSVEYTEATL